MVPGGGVAGKGGRKGARGGFGWEGGERGQCMWVCVTSRQDLSSCFVRDPRLMITLMGMVWWVESSYHTRSFRGSSHSRLSTITRSGTLSFSMGVSAHGGLGWWWWWCERGRLGGHQAMGENRASLVRHLPRAAPPSTGRARCAHTVDPARTVAIAGVVWCGVGDSAARASVCVGWGAPLRHTMSDTGAGTVVLPPHTQSASGPST